LDPVARAVALDIKRDRGPVMPPLLPMVEPPVQDQTGIRWSVIHSPAQEVVNTRIIMIIVTIMQEQEAAIALVGG